MKIQYYDNGHLSQHKRLLICGGDQHQLYRRCKGRTSQPSVAIMCAALVRVSSPLNMDAPICAYEKGKCF